MLIVKLLSQNTLAIQQSFSANNSLEQKLDIGANCAEAKLAQSTRDFISKYEIALKESQELSYWCQVMIDSNIVPIKKFDLLRQENKEITNILAATITSLKKKSF